MEPDWTDVEARLAALTMRELKPIKHDWFNGSLGGLSSKADIVREMVSQMRYWWRLPDGRGRVGNVLRDLHRAEEARHADK